MTVDVFVPYRGIYFLYKTIFLNRDEIIVFVPYRGIYFLYAEAGLYVKAQTNSFSSPIGESTFSTNGCANVLHMCANCFRPLSGNLLSLRRKNQRGHLLHAGFRPLSGNLLSLQELTNGIIQRTKEFSSPIGESTFSTVT